MAHSLSAKKRNRQNITHRERNKTRKSELKTQVKQYITSVQAGDVDTATAQLVKVCRKLDQVAAKGTIHKNTAARQKSRLAKKLVTATAD